MRFRGLTVALAVFLALGAVSHDAGPTGGIASANSVAPPVLDPCAPGVLGDVTADGVTSLGDAQQILRAAVGLSVTPTVQGRLASHGDVNSDGSTSLGDAQQVLRFAVGLSVSFSIGDPMCGIEVTTSTSGSGVDTGYDVHLDGAFAMAIGASETIELNGLDVGDYTVALQDIASNCDVTNGSRSRNVSVTEGSTPSVTFVVECGTGTGPITVQTVVSGSGPGSFTATLDGGMPLSVPANGSNTWTGIAVGEHTVAISPGACTVSGGNSQTFTHLGNTTIQFQISC